MDLSQAQPTAENPERPLPAAVTLIDRDGPPLSLGGQWHFGHLGLVAATERLLPAAVAAITGASSGLEAPLADWAGPHRCAIVTPSLRDGVSTVMARPPPRVVACLAHAEALALCHHDNGVVQQTVEQ